MSVLLFGGASAPPTAWPPPPRSPLPPFDPDTTDPQTGAPLPVHKTLNFKGGPPDPHVRREQFCGLRVPSLPALPNGASPAGFLCSWFIDRYSEQQQNDAVEAMRAAGPTHWTLSWPDSRAVGKTIADFVGTAQWLQSQGFWVDVHCFAKDIDPNNPDPATAFPVLDALVDANAITLATVAWELNLFNSPEHCDVLCDALGPRYPSLIWCLHFSTAYAHYAHNTGDSPTAFWNRRIANGIRRLKYQCVPVNGTDTPDSWSAGMMQARGNDVLVRLAPGGGWRTSGVDVDMWETTATFQFNGQQSELMGDLRGYESMCSPGPMALSGYGNGARHPDGSAL